MLLADNDKQLVAQFQEACPSWRGVKTGFRALASDFQPPTDYYPQDAELCQIIDSSASDVQERLKEPLTLCNETITLWSQLKGSHAQKADLKRLPLLPAANQSRDFAFQQTAGLGAAPTPAEQQAAPADKDAELDDEEGGDDFEQPDAVGMLSDEVMGDTGDACGLALRCPESCTEAQMHVIVQSASLKYSCALDSG